jgi:[acyl-carrier-protein] S-malonyltransferase
MQCLTFMAFGFIFSGQGAQQVGMGKSLYENSAAARACFDQAKDILPFDLKQLCFEGPENELTQTKVCQPALYVHGYSIVAALREAGKLPEIAGAAGLSLGELTAYAVAGVYDFETGLRIVAERGRLMQECCEATVGTMASLIGGDVPSAEKLAAECDVDLGNLNCPGQSVLSGEVDKVKAAVAKAKEAGFKMAVPLKVAGAYHSRLMKPAAEKFDAFLKSLPPFSAPAVPVFSNALGARIEDPDQIKQALVDQVTSTVRWTDCVQAMMALGIKDYYECGPGGTLAGLAKRIDRDLNVTSLSTYEELPLS